MIFRWSPWKISVLEILEVDLQVFASRRNFCSRHRIWRQIRLSAPLPRAIGLSKSENFGEKRFSYQKSPKNFLDQFFVLISKITAKNYYKIVFGGFLVKWYDTNTICWWSLRDCNFTNTCSISIFLDVLKSPDPNSLISGHFGRKISHYNIKNLRWSCVNFAKTICTTLLRLI